MQTDSNKKTTYMKIDGIFCFACTGIIKGIIEEIPEVVSVQVNYATSILSILHYDSLNMSEVENRLKSKGYTGRVIDRFQGEVSGAESLKAERRKILITFFLSILLVHNPWFSVNGYVQLSAATIIMLIAGKNIYQTALHSISGGKANMAVLVLLSTMAAYIYSVVALFYGQQLGLSDYYFEAAGTVLVFVQISKYLEKASGMNSMNQMEDLSGIIPSKSVRLNGEQWETVDVTAIRDGDSVKIGPGEIIPVDGVVVSGHSQIDDSTLTGESFLKEVKEGLPVYASSVNYNNYLIVQASGSVSESMFSRLLNQTLEGMSQANSNSQRMVDRFSAWFLKLVLCISVAAFVIWYAYLMPGDLARALRIAISVLVVACPCTMGLIVSMMMNYAMTALARHGIVLKDHLAIEKLAAVNCFCFDKTGTVTSTEMQVVDFEILEGETQQIMDGVMSLEVKVSHPISNALINSKQFQNYQTKEVEKFLYEHGVLSGIIEGRFFEIIAESDDSQSCTHILDVYVDHICAAKIVCEESIRQGSAKILEVLRKSGFDTLMISGDTFCKCSYVAEKIGIDTIFSNQTPEEKLEVVEQCKIKGKVAMAGDGINDLPAMMKADVSIAIGKIKDLSLGAADVVITKNRIIDILKVLYISHKTMNGIRRGLMISAVYNVIGIMLAACGFISPVLAASLMSISSVSTTVLAYRFNISIQDITFEKVLGEISMFKKTICW